jgi:hypothetical protein
MKKTASRWPRILALGLLLRALPAASSPLRAFTRAIPGEAVAQNEPMNFNLEGRITKLEESKFTVTTGENILFHVRYNDKTEIKQQDGSAASAKDFRVKMTVKVEGDLTESGEIVARKIEIQQEAGSKSPPPR